MGPFSEAEKDAAQTEEGVGEAGSYDSKVKFCSKIANPLAKEKLCKKILKLCKKASQRKQTKRGVKEVVKALQKKQRGICILAGDISPIDVLSHVPIVCEDHQIPYIYIPSKQELGAAALSKRPTSCMLLLPNPPNRVPTNDADAKKFAKIYAKVEK
ncbi:nucleolar protein [Dunaliella salina]|uniref:H/ACA ribonucleoprotein complex subunit 2 n=1 Tax=Dunaliella salina TaxID=3046 RepID=A0ABQ7GLW3_DUNSA|nr:nucleolar protein [Dunaliella salina]|eukprot:KAF5835597.1 nucleolar protein [Dunaliella salina]